MHRNKEGGYKGKYTENSISAHWNNSLPTQKFEQLLLKNKRKTIESIYQNHMIKIVIQSQDGHNHQLQFRG